MASKFLSTCVHVNGYVQSNSYLQDNIIFMISGHITFISNSGLVLNTVVPL